MPVKKNYTETVCHGWVKRDHEMQPISVTVPGTFQSEARAQAAARKVEPDFVIDTWTATKTTYIMSDADFKQMAERTDTVEI